MKTIDVYQCELDKGIPLEHVGKVKYIGDSFGADSFTANEMYDIVRNQHGQLAVVDDSGEDYLWDLRNPRPFNGEEPTDGKFELVEDYTGELAKIYNSNQIQNISANKPPAGGFFIVGVHGER